MVKEKRKLFGRKDNRVINNSKNIINKNSKLKNKNINKEQEKIIITAYYKVNHSIELLDFLLLKCKTSRNNVKELLARHKVLVNGSMVSKYDFMLAKDDEVKISKHSINNETTKIKKNSNYKPKLPFKIIYEDENFIAINKPNSLLSVESDTDRNCAFGILFNYLQSINKNNRPYILHRIDKETSGVLVFAKNIKLHSMLKMNWNNFVKTREYIAIVEGVLEKDSGTITTYLKENKNNLVYSTNDKTGQLAVTHYKVIKKTDDYSMLRVNIDTGRKNQIRVHLKDLGHNIIGDDKYGYNKSPLNRLGLHASKLEFINPETKQLISISAPIPEIFNKLFS